MQVLLGLLYITIGRVAEWSKASVLKTEVANATGGSNPFPFYSGVSPSGKAADFEFAIVGSSPTIPIIFGWVA